MATSKTDIVNLAASHLGQPTIESIDTDTTEIGELARSSYDQLLDAMLRSYTWNFATTRRALSATGTAPLYGFTNAYTLEDDMLRIVSIEGDLNVDWVIEDGEILTDLGSPINVRCIVRVTDTSKYDALFVQAFSHRLAMEWTERILKSSTSREEQLRLFTEKLREAKSIDSTEKTPEVVEASGWVRSRGGHAVRRAVLSGDPQPL